MSESSRLSLLNTCLATLFCAGLALSIYTYYVESRLKMQEDYSAVCDINEHISCSKVFKSPYSKGFGILPEDSIFYVSSSIYGIIYYTLMLFLAYSPSLQVTKLVFFKVILSNCLTPYFAYLLYFVLHDLCLVCVSVYIVNALCLLVTYYKLKLLSSSVEKYESKIKIN